MFNLLTKLELIIHYWNRSRLFKKLFQKEDPYQTKYNHFEQLKHITIIDEIKDRRYDNALEIGCAEGFFTAWLLEYCNNVIGIDISSSAIKKAKQQYSKDRIIFICKNIVNLKPKNLFDLIVAVDICYYLGQEHSWRHIEDELDRWASWLGNSGRIVLAHCFNEKTHPKDWLGYHIMEGYRKILEKAGLHLKNEKIIYGTKNNISHSYLLSVLEKNK